MKTFKDFKKKIDGIMEYSTLSQTGAWQTVNGTGSHHIDQDKALAEVNMFIARNLDRLFTDPVDAINMLRSKLNFVGFDFTGLDLNLIQQAVDCRLGLLCLRKQ